MDMWQIMLNGLRGGLNQSLQGNPLEFAQLRSPNKWPRTAEVHSPLISQHHQQQLQLPPVPSLPVPPLTQTQSPQRFGLTEINPLQQIFQHYCNDLVRPSATPSTIPPPQHLYALLQQMLRRPGVEPNGHARPVHNISPTDMSKSRTMAPVAGHGAGSSSINEIQDLSAPLYDTGSELNNSTEQGNWTTMFSPSTNSSPTELNSSALQHTPTDLVQPSKNRRSHCITTEGTDDLLMRVGPTSPMIQTPTRPDPSALSHDPTTTPWNSLIHQKTPNWPKQDHPVPFRSAGEMFAPTTPSASTPSPACTTPPAEALQRQAFEQYYWAMIQRQYCMFVYQNLLQNLNVPSTQTSNVSPPIPTTFSRSTHPRSPSKFARNSVSSSRTITSPTSSRSPQKSHMTNGKNRHPLPSREPLFSKSFDNPTPADPAADSTTVDGLTYECKLCHKTYSQASALKMHVRTHTLPCRCAHCGKSFSRKWLLKGHERTHTGERPYACNLCTRSFADRSNLRAHMQTHQREKRYSCPNCPRSFSRMGLLNKHMIQCRTMNDTYGETPATIRNLHTKSLDYSN